jgi:atypical dual specificity phosphatase
MAELDEPLEQEPNMAEVQPHLLIGDIVAAQSPELLAAAGVTRLVDLANMFPQADAPRLLEVNEGLDPPIVSRLEVHVTDVATEDISWAFDAVNNYIDEAHSRGEKVLVHCFQGKSRSSTTVIAYLIMSQGYTLREAFDLVKRARASINPNDGFKRALMALERSRFPDQPPSMTFKVKAAVGPPARLRARGASGAAPDGVTT